MGVRPTEIGPAEDNPMFLLFVCLFLWAGGWRRTISAMNPHLTFRQVDFDMTLRYLCEDAN